MKKKVDSNKYNPNLDLNKDGKLDKSDKELAAKALATNFKKVKEEPIKEVPPEPMDGKIARVDISLIYRKGMIVPMKQIEEWKMVGIDISSWFD